MTKGQRDIASFLVRFTQDLWQDAQGDPQVHWRGHIRHIQGDEEVRFTSFTEAVDFIQRYLAQLTLGALDTLPGGDKMDQEKTLRESFKLWEEFASSYTEIMFKTMEQTLKQSQAFTHQMDEAVQQALKSWRLPVQADQAQIIEAVNNLQAQVEALAKKVEGMEKALEE
jgi:gas vesicle protein